MKKEHALRVLASPPDPKQRAILHLNGPSTVIVRGPDATLPDLCCGACGASLVVGMPRRSFSNIVFRCNECGAYNET